MKLRSRRGIPIPAAVAALVFLAACAPAATPAPTRAPAPPTPTSAAAQPVAQPTVSPAAKLAPTATPVAKPEAKSGPPTKPANFPSGAIQIIVPFNPGGGADASQRVFNKYAEPIVGQPLTIVNKAGAGGVTGWFELVRSKPDGQTLAIVTPPFNVLPVLVQPRQTPYKLDQFTNICIYAIVPDVLYAREEGPFKTLKDLVDFAKANPNKVKAANTGTAGADHLTTLLIENATGTQFTQVPFTGGAESLQATLAGTTDIMVGSTLYAESQQGKLRPLAIATEQRDPKYPDVPTFKELGYNVVAERYRALAGPAGLPQPLVDYWAAVCKQVVDNPEFQDEIGKQGQPAAYRGPAEANRLINQMATDLQAVVEKYNLVNQ